MFRFSMLVKPLPSSHSALMPVYSPRHSPMLFQPCSARVCQRGRGGEEKERQRFLRLGVESGGWEAWSGGPRVESVCLEVEVHLVVERRSVVLLHLLCDLFGGGCHSSRKMSHGPPRRADFAPKSPGKMVQNGKGGFYEEEEGRDRVCRAGERERRGGGGGRQRGGPAGEHPESCPPWLMSTPPFSSSCPSLCPCPLFKKAERSSDASVTQALTLRSPALELLLPHNQSEWKKDTREHKSNFAPFGVGCFF